MRRSIFLSQCLDHILPFVGCFALFVLTPLSLGMSALALFPKSPFFLLTSLMGALFVSSLSYRTLCILLFDSTLGMKLFGLRPRDEEAGRELIMAHVWEALSLACPLLWFLEILARKAGKRIGFDYVFCYKNLL
jgi:hypothetical protein